jgi:hypothetical protein
LNEYKGQLDSESNRFSTNSLGTITDTQGVINNGEDYYYDSNGNRIDTAAYN